MRRTAAGEAILSATHSNGATDGRVRSTSPIEEREQTMNQIDNTLVVAQAGQDGGAAGAVFLVLYLLNGRLYLRRREAVEGR